MILQLKRNWMQDGYSISKKCLTCQNLMNLRTRTLRMIWTFTTCNPPSQADVETAIKARKNGKSPGIDSRQVELLKADTSTSSLVLADLFAKIWNLLGIPIDWSIRLIHTIPKKGASTIVTTVARHNTSLHFSSFPARNSAEHSSKWLKVPLIQSWGPNKLLYRPRLQSLRFSSPEHNCMNSALKGMFSIRQCGRS